MKNMNRKERKLHNLNIKLDILSMILWLFSGCIDWDSVPILFAAVWFAIMAIFLVGRVIYAEFIINW